MTEISPAGLAHQIDPETGEVAQVALTLLAHEGVQRAVPVLGGGFQPAEYWLGVYQPRYAFISGTGRETFGFDALLELLAAAPERMLRIEGFHAAQKIGLFWLGEDEKLVGFAVMSMFGRSEAE
jgi:hypothetical protein